MQDLIKRYFWVLGAAVVMLCSVFAAKATSHIIEAAVLSDSDHAPAIPVVMPSPATPVKVAHNKDGAPFAARNMFCAECLPPVAPVNADPLAVQNTSLPLILLATNVGLKDEESYATIINTENQHQGSFSLGDRVPGASGALKAIHYKYIEFENNNHIERLVLQGASAPPPTPVAAAETKPEGDGDELQAAIDAGIKTTGENTYEIDRALVDKILANPMGVAKGARVVPAVQNGKPAGFKLYAIRPSSVYAKLGLTNGDTLSSINGFELTSADKALEVYTKLREATSLEVEIQRRGKSMTLKYTIR
jgi:general secretion pathway protein C